jgi:hypothetical protein
MEIERPDAQWAPPPPRRSAPAGGELALPSDAPNPPALPARPRRRGLLLAGSLACTALALVLGSMAAGQYRTDRAPGAVVGRYFAALAAGDAPAALALATTVPPSPYLTSTVLRQQLSIAQLTDVLVRDTVVRGRTATTQVSYRLAFPSASTQVVDAVDLVRSGSSWRLTRAATDIDLSAISAGTNRLTFAGRPLPTGRVQVFPGALPVATDNPAVQPAGRPMIRLIDENQDTQLNAVLSSDARRALGQALTSALDACLTGSSRDPHCPLPSATRPVPGSLRGTVNPARSDPPNIALSTAADGMIELTDRVSVQGSWRTWDFNNQAVLRSGQTDLDVQAKASIADLATIYWDPP